MAYRTVNPYNNEVVATFEDLTDQVVRFPDAEYTGVALEDDRRLVSVIGTDPSSSRRRKCRT